MSVAIIINPVSGGSTPDAARRRARLASEIVARLGEEAHVWVTNGPGHARTLAAEAVRRESRLVVAWGGDGTVNEIASALVFARTPLAIVPAGSGNGLARELHVSTRPERAIERALAAAPRPIDVGEIAGRYFVNIAGIGFDAEVAARFNQPENTSRGLRGYAWLTARSFFTYRGREYVVTADGQSLRVRALLVVIANGTEFGNRILIARGARVDDGVLDVVIVEDRSFAATVSRVPWLVARQVHRVPQWSTRPARQVTIECAEPMMFHVDGEPVDGGRRLEARIHPGALNVCV